MTDEQVTPESFRQRLSANAEDFDQIVADMLAALETMQAERDAAVEREKSYRRAISDAEACAELDRLQTSIAAERGARERLCNALNNRDGTLRAIVEKAENAHPEDFGIVLATITHYAVDALSDFPQDTFADKALREAAKEFFNATVASQKHSPGFSSSRCVYVEATHAELRDRVNRAADALEAALTAEGPAPQQPEKYYMNADERAVMDEALQLSGKRIYPNDAED